MKTVPYSALALATMAITTLSIATSSTDKRLAARSTPAAAAPQLGTGPTLGAAIGGLGPNGAQLNELNYSALGAPNLTSDAVRTLKVGDHVAIPLPEGGVLDFVVSWRSWTAADEQQVHLRQGLSPNATYGIISQVGPRLTGFFQRRDGVAYALVPTEHGWSRVTERPNYGDLECGVDRVRAQAPHASEDRVHPEGGLAGAVTPCPPEVTPFYVPPGLKKDSGIVIDVLFVFSVDANDEIVSGGLTAYDQAVITVAQANLALKNSTEQGATGFDGQDQDNELNQNCGYDGPYAFGAAVNGVIDAPNAPDGPFSCDKEDPAMRAEHLAKAGVSPAEGDVCTPRIRLVAALVCDGFFGSEEPFVSTGQAVDLARIEDPTDGILDYVQLWRDALGADSVALIGKDYGSDSAFVGLASVMNDANTFPQGMAGLSIPANPHPIVDETNPAVGLGGTGSISTLQAFSESPYCLLDLEILGDLTYAHELGHNFGCQHNHENGAETQNALFPDSFGFRDEDAKGGFRTIMSYGDQWTRLPGFSNPKKRWVDFVDANGDPIADDTDFAGKEFDFKCFAIDGTGTGANYVASSGVPTNTCTVEGDDDPAEAAAMVVGPSDSVIEDNAKESAYNARSISQVKFDFAKFRCSIFAPVDCNNNLIDDFVESLDGTNEDCDANGIPDECETAVEDPGIPSPIDCNQDQIPDSCNIANGDSQDVNANGIPDECEDSTLLFRETFENIPLGSHDSELPICKVAPATLAEIRLTDPEFPEYFATIESTDYSPDPLDTAFVYSDFVPSLFQYALGENGNMNLRGVLGQGFGMAFGNRAFGQRLDFNAETGDFSSGNGVVIIKLARSAAEARFYLNAADFASYFAFDPPLPNLVNHPYLEENIVVVDAISVDPLTGAETVVSQKQYDLRGVQTPAVPSGFEFAIIRAEPGAPAISFDKIIITGAFIALDNLSLDLGQEFEPCGADIAGGDPVQGLPTPDGHVRADDLLVVLATFGLTVDPGSPLTGIADINGDGFVDAFDLVEIFSAWGTCPGSGVPGG
ncbi:MAG: hypothetical protein EXS03_01130 [Phycisphaerales bacterium]|nr:hypothetical protein [Phycisphaerales bacterium]